MSLKKWRYIMAGSGTSQGRPTCLFCVGKAIADVLFQHIDNFITTKTFYYEYDNSGIEINA